MNGLHIKTCPNHYLVCWKPSLTKGKVNVILCINLNGQFFMWYNLKLLPRFVILVIYFPSLWWMRVKLIKRSALYITSLMKRCYWFPSFVDCSWLSFTFKCCEFFLNIYIFHDALYCYSKPSICFIYSTVLSVIKVECTCSWIWITLLEL